MEHVLFTVATDGNLYYTRTEEGGLLASVEVVKPETPETYAVAMSELMKKTVEVTRDYLA